MTSGARAVVTLLAGQGQPPVVRRRTDRFLLGSLTCAVVLAAVAMVVLGGGPWGPGIISVAALSVVSAWTVRTGRLRAVLAGLVASTLVVMVLVLPIYPTQAVGLLALIYCAMTLYEDVVAWAVTLVGSTAATLVGAGVDPATVFGPHHRHQVEDAGSLAGHLLMFLLAATASAVAWVVVLRARAAERDARLAERAVALLLPALSGSASSAVADEGERLSDRALEHVRALSARGRAMLDGLEEVVVEVGHDGRVDYANPAAARLWGRRVDELVGQDAGALLLLPWPTLAGAADSGSPVRTTAVSTAGEHVPVQASVVPLLAGADETGFVVTVRNLTDRLAAQEAALERQRLLTQRRTALELNDTVVQGLTVAVYGQELGDVDDALAVSRETLARAREMVAALLDDDVPLEPAALRRLTPATPVQDGTVDDSVWALPSGPEERLF